MSALPVRDGFVVSGVKAASIRLPSPERGVAIRINVQSRRVEATCTARSCWIRRIGVVRQAPFNGPGAIEIVVDQNRSSEERAGRIVKMVSEAETRKSPTQRFTDRFEPYFCTAVLALAVLLPSSRAVVVDDHSAIGFYRARWPFGRGQPVRVAIATPSAVLSGYRPRCARAVVLIKGGAPLRKARDRLMRSRLTDRARLTEGRPRITGRLPAPDIDEAELLATAGLRRRR